MRFEVTIITCGLLLTGAAVGVAQDSSAPKGTEHAVSLTTEDRTELLRLKKRFDKLSEGERERLRKLHQQITRDPKSEQLRRTLQRYNQWLQTLDPVLQAELQGLSSKERIARIRELRKRDEERITPEIEGLELPRSDLVKIRSWMMSIYLASNQAEIISWMPPQFQKMYRGTKDSKRRRFLLHAALALRPNHRELPLPEPAESSVLMRRLSPQGREVLGSESDLKPKLARWFERTLLLRQQSEVSERALRKFYEKNLSDEQRQQLDDLPLEEHKRRLKRLYLIHFVMRRAQVATNQEGGRDKRPPNRERPTPERRRTESNKPKR